MRITWVSAQAYSVPVEVPLLLKKYHLPFVLVRLGTENGIEPHGLVMGIDAARPMASLISDRVAPTLEGESILNHERIWTTLMSRFKCVGGERRLDSGLR